MLIVPYRLDELHFAYCYHVYLRWNTHRLCPFPELVRLDQTTLQALVEHLSLRVLECASGSTEVRALVSLQPQEPVSACASKIKGQTSKWLREALGTNAPAQLLSKGYFACTSGKSEAKQVEDYLEGQSEHHGYSARVVPPVFVASYPLSEATETRLHAKHAHAVAQYHLVLATWWRRGVFGEVEGRAVAECWRALEDRERFALLKVSFVPDHVHLAVRTHPSVAPTDLVLTLMNAAQELLWQRFADAVIQARVDRLWQASAYVGGFGDLATPKIERYLQNWAAQHGEDRG
jgi:putative transposase